MCKIALCKDLYASLLTFMENVMKEHPEEFITLAPRLHVYNPLLEGYRRPVDPTEKQTRCCHFGWKTPDVPIKTQTPGNPPQVSAMTPTSVWSTWRVGISGPGETCLVQF